MQANRQLFAWFRPRRKVQVVDCKVFTNTALSESDYEVIRKFFIPEDNTSQGTNEYEEDARKAEDRIKEEEETNYGYVSVSTET